MSLLTFERTIRNQLQVHAANIEKYFKSDVVYYSGPILQGLEKLFRDTIEDLVANPNEDIPEGEAKRLTVILTTGGGSAETVEKIVDIIRYHYQEVDFIVPDYAMSAGTIMCLSGDRILMDYSSSLGPIDPQLQKKDGSMVPAMGYLDKVEEWIEKSYNGTLSPAELMLLQKMDFAELSRYEEAMTLTISLLQEWLVKYKFKSWTAHRSDPRIIGTEVTMEQKRDRANEIAALLGDHKHWHSHGRFIGMKTLREVLKLEIEDFRDLEVNSDIREYSDLILAYIDQVKIPYLMHTRRS